MNFTIYRDTLNPAFWSNMEFDQKVRLDLLKIAKDFYKSSELNAPIKDVLLLGSNTNYNWTEFSDLDLHILIDFNDLNVGDYAEELTKLIKSSWNEKHDIKLKGFNVEVYIQDINDINHSEAVFSLMKNKWIKEPIKHKNIKINKEYIKKKYKDITHRINRIVNGDCGDSEKCLEATTTLMNDIKRMRQSGLDKKGELSEENIVFKLLRNTDYIAKLVDAKPKFYDDMFNKQNNLNENSTINKTDLNDYKIQFHDDEFTITDSLGGKAEGVFKDDFVRISHIYSVPPKLRQTEEENSLKKRGFMYKVIHALKKNNFKYVEFWLPTTQCQSAYLKLLEKGILSNPKKIKTDGTKPHPTVFNITENINENKFNFVVLPWKDVDRLDISPSENTNVFNFEEFGIFISKKPNSNAVNARPSIIDKCFYLKGYYDQNKNFTFIGDTTNQNLIDFIKSNI